MAFRAWLVAAVLLINVAQPLDVLRIKVTIVDADGHARPVPRHALLISENPSSAPPRQAVTSLDGTAEVRLRPGNYTVESDEPLIFQGKAYQWRQTLDIPAGRVTSLELTAGNAVIEPAGSGAPSASSAASGNASALLLDWQNSVLSIWSPTAHGSGFLIDARGLIATNQRLVGKATMLEVQLSATEKVAARVLSKDPDRNVAILWIDPKAVAPAHPVKLAYADAGPPPADRDRVFAISTPMHDEKSLSSGTVSRVNTHTILSDIRIDEDSLGGPLFNAAGGVIAITSPDDDTSSARSSAFRAVRIDEARSVIADAETKMLKSEAPNGAPLPVEPPRPSDDEALKEAAKRRTGSLAPYTVKAADFDVSLITPVLVYGARHQVESVSGRERERGGRNAAEMQGGLCPRQSAGAADSRDAEARRKPLDDDRARRGADAGRVASAHQAHQGRLLQDADRLRRCRGDADPSFQNRTARGRERCRLRRTVCRRSRRDRSPLRHGEADPVLGQESREGGHARHRPENPSADLAGLRALPGRSEIGAAKCYSPRLHTLGETHGKTASGEEETIGREASGNTRRFDNGDTRDPDAGRDTDAAGGTGGARDTGDAGGPRRACQSGTSRCAWQATS
jgi:S1-C subfamily serine protease